MEREVAFGTTYLSNPCPSSSRYKLTRFRAPHTLLLLRSYHPRFSPRTSSTILGSISLIGARPPSRPIVCDRGEKQSSPPPLSLFVQRQRRIFRNEKTMVDELIPVYISAVLSSVNWETGKSSNGFV